MFQNSGKAVGWAALIWLIGFVWASIVFMVPALKEIPSIAYVSKYPAISFPLLIAYPFLASAFVKRLLGAATDRKKEGLEVGVTFFAVNVLLDFLVIVILLNSGTIFFASLTLWLGYAILLLVPALKGRGMQRSAADAP